MVEKILNQINSKMENLIEILQIGLNTIFLNLKKGFKNLLNLIKFLTDKLFSFIDSKSKFLRYIGIPWTLLIPKFWELYFKNSVNTLPIFQPGVHMIRAKVGGGKSLLSLIIADRYLKQTGYASYFTSPVEKPKLSEDGKYWYVMHRVYNPKDYYQKGKKILNYNTDKYKAMFKDEEHLRYNPRLNKTRDYNDYFVPEHEDELLMRHQGMDHGIYKFSQHMKLDYQAMDSLTYMHEIELKKALTLKQWLEDGLLRIFPVKIKFNSYTIANDFKGGMDRKKVRRSYNVMVPFELLERFDTLAEARKYQHLPKDYK